MPPAWFENCNCHFRGDVTCTLLAGEEPYAPCVIRGEMTGCFSYMRIPDDVQEALEASGMLPKLGDEVRAQSAASAVDSEDTNGRRLRSRSRDLRDPVDFTPVKLLVKIEAHNTFLADDPDGFD
mmetsp:Transcript_10092/g.29938  ORF Transcript_10092/g.29938 Transcript_10092/m.29938 type:complete len:124 (+) Transcript_10092:772-1143(+)